MFNETNYRDGNIDRPIILRIVEFNVKSDIIFKRERSFLLRFTSDQRSLKLTDLSSVNCGSI